jgi:hypothetical protein
MWLVSSQSKFLKKKKWEKEKKRGPCPLGNLSSMMREYASEISLFSFPT